MDKFTVDLKVSMGFSYAKVCFHDFLQKSFPFPELLTGNENWSRCSRGRKEMTFWRINFFDVHFLGIALFFGRADYNHG